MFGVVLACTGGAVEPVTPAPPPVTAPVVVKEATKTPETEVVAPVDVAEPTKAEGPAPVVVKEPPTVAVAVEPSKELDVEARLVEANSAPACGGIHANVVMRYEIIKVIAGGYPDMALYAAHSCPEMGATQCKGLPGERIKKFRNGEVHRLQLKQGRISGALFDKFKADSSAPRYRVRCASLVPPPTP